eukprot:15343824-Alexandrium_andersonii.AAC.1
MDPERSFLRLVHFSPFASTGKRRPTASGRHHTPSSRRTNFASRPLSERGGTSPFQGSEASI